MSSGDWSASLSNEEGFSLSDTKGASGKNTLRVLAARNISGDTRETDVYFYYNNELRYTYRISQAEEQPYLDLATTSLSLTGDAQDCTITIETNQASWNYSFEGGSQDWISEKTKDNSSVQFSLKENKTDIERSVTIKFASDLHPEIFNYLKITQDYVVDAPKADLLDVEFGENCAAQDVSDMHMTIDASCIDATVSTTYSSKYGRYIAIFSKAATKGALEGGYYKIPYTDRTDFAEKLEDGFTIEILVCRYDDPINQQIKPFSSTQAGGTGICFRAAASNEINFEVHTGGTRTGVGYKFTGGGWRELYSGVTPQKGIYYHAIGTWDKATGTACLYVNGVLTKTLTTATGNYDHMTSSVNAYWFGIGADPNSSDKGELSFNGEVVIARLYDDALTARQVDALWKLVK
jgi:glycerophosphoryl diester phosphodiesterase